MNECQTSEMKTSRRVASFEHGVRRAFRTINRSRRTKKKHDTSEEETHKNIAQDRCSWNRLVTAAPLIFSTFPSRTIPLSSFLLLSPFLSPSVLFLYSNTCSSPFSPCSFRFNAHMTHRPRTCMQSTIPYILSVTTQPPLVLSPPSPVLSASYTINRSRPPRAKRETRRAFGARRCRCISNCDGAGGRAAHSADGNRPQSSTRHTNALDVNTDRPTDRRTNDEAGRIISPVRRTPTPSSCDVTRQPIEPRALARFQYRPHISPDTRRSARRPSYTRRHAGKGTKSAPPQCSSVLSFRPVLVFNSPDLFHLLN